MTGPGPHNAGSTPQPPQHQPQRPPAAGGSRRNLIVAVAFIALIVIIGLVVWLVTKKSPDQGAPQTGSIQQPAVSSAGGFDPKTVLEPGKIVPSNWGVFLDGAALDSFKNSIGKFKGEDASAANCYYGLNRTSGIWFGFIACGPTKSSDSSSQNWWESDASINSSNLIEMSSGSKWSRSSGPPAKGIRADGSQ